MKAVCSFKIAGTSYSVIQHHVADGWMMQSHQCKKIYNLQVLTCHAECGAY